MSGHFNYTTNTWYDLRDVQGPRRDVVSINQQSEATYITLACGHVGNFNQIFDYSKEKQMHCFDCMYAVDNVIRKEQR